MGKYDEAKILLQYLASADPRDSRIWFGTAKTAARLNDHPLVIEALLRSLQFAPFIPQTETFLESELSQRHFVRSDFPNKDIWNALLLFKKIHGNEGGLSTGDLLLTASVIRAFPDLYIPYFAAGKIYASLGRRTESEAAFRQCLSRAPEHPFIHRELAYLYLRNGDCLPGKQHAALYIQTSQSIEDYQALREAMERCQ
jgi:tetratricopeptide (TPR) repeat protein